MLIEQTTKYFIQKQNLNGEWINYYTNGGDGYDLKYCEDRIYELRGDYSTVNFRVVKVTLTVEEIK